METKQEHLKLLAKSWLSQLVWSDAYDYEGWTVDLKRPFGNSSVEIDILKLLNIESEFKDEYSEDQINYAADLYQKLGIYLKEIGNNL